MSYYSFYRPMEGRRLSRPSWQASHRDGFTCPQAVTHRSTNRARRRVTSFQPKRVTNYATPPTNAVCRIRCLQSTTTRTRCSHILLNSVGKSNKCARNFFQQLSHNRKNTNSKYLNAIWRCFNYSLLSKP